MMSEPARLSCGCAVTTERDFMGRVIGTIVEHDPQCKRQDHQLGQVVIMPGRQHARPE